jgi:hypothetical protein
LGAGNDSPGGLPKGDGDFFQLTGKIRGLLGQIETQSQDGERKAAGAGDRLHQQAGQLLIFPKKVVGPLEAGFDSAERLNRVSCSQGSKDGKKG